MLPYMNYTPRSLNEIVSKNKKLKNYFLRYVGIGIFILLQIISKVLIHL